MMSTRHLNSVHRHSEQAMPQTASGQLAHWKLVVLSIALTAAWTAKADLVFDNMSNYENSVSGASVSATGSTPNTFMGDGYTLAPGTVSITGFDLFPVNLSGTSYTGIKISIFVWGSVNTSGSVNAATPAFGNLLGSYTFTSTDAYGTGFFFPIEGSPVGSAPGFSLATPLTSIISYGTTPTVGSQVFNGYYRNAASETDGNFTSSLRSLGQQNQSLGLRVFGDVTAVPEPAVFSIAGLGAAALLIRRRRH
jgi:hypothetical protein